MTEEQINELYKLARAFCIKKHIFFDDDLIQDLVIFVYERFHKYDESKGRFSTFCFMCFNNYMCDKCRKPNKPEICINNEDLLFIDNYCDPCQKLIIGEIMGLIEQDNIMFDWLYGLSTDELALKYDKHRTTISRYITKRIEELRKQYIGG